MPIPLAPPFIVAAAVLGQTAGLTPWRPIPMLPAPIIPMPPIPMLFIPMPPMPMAPMPMPMPPMPRAPRPLLPAILDSLQFLPQEEEDLVVFAFFLEAAAYLAAKFFLVASFLAVSLTFLLRRISSPFFLAIMARFLMSAFLATSCFLTARLALTAPFLPAQPPLAAAAQSPLGLGASLSPLSPLSPLSVLAAASSFFSSLAASCSA